MRRDISGWMVRLTDELIDRYMAEGHWRGRVITDEMQKVAEARRHDVLMIDGEKAISCNELAQQARFLAAGLARRGLKQGDVISFQLPNWHEAAIINLAAAMSGLVVHPLVPIYRQAEVGFMSRDCRSRLLFVPRNFRGFDYAAMAHELRAELPELNDVIIVRGGGGSDSFETLIEEGRGAPSHSAQVDANAVKIVMYTSGTTGRPKGVLHTHNTLMTELRAQIEFWRIGMGDVIFMPSPVTHITGYLLGLELPVVTGVPAVLMDLWDAEKALALIKRHGCTLTVGATPFLQEMLAAAERAGEGLPGFRLFACGGASVPPELIHRAYAQFHDCLAMRVYGSTETPSVSLGVQDRGEQTLAATTDGRVVGNDVKIMGSEDEPSSPMSEGEIVVRGPEMFVGYTNPNDNEDAFSDGYFRTGDLGRLSPDGFVTVAGRKKDLIIRGGENISPKEIEDALFTHPAVADVAVVAMPHARLGETVCAFVVLRNEARFELEDARRHLCTRQGLAPQKAPEAVHVVEALPKTPSGKVKKDALRALCASTGPSGGPRSS